MGNVPRFIGKFVDLALGTEVRVVDKVNLPCDLVLVTFVSPILIGKSIRALSKIELHLGDGHFRSYTPANIDSVSGSVSVCFHNHKQGVASQWLKRLKLGAVTKMFGPEGGIEIPKNREIFLLGDLTAVGAFMSVLQARGRAEGVHCFLINESEEVTVLEIDKSLVIEMQGWKGVSNKLLDLVPKASEPLFFIIGEKHKNQDTRDSLVQELNVSSDQVRIKNYWKRK